MRYLVAGFSTTCGALVVLAFQLGNDWITIGHGIHPILAGGFVVVAFCLPFVMASLVSDYSEIE